MPRSISENVQGHAGSDKSHCSALAGLATTPPAPSEGLMVNVQEDLGKAMQSDGEGCGSAGHDAVRTGAESRLPVETAAPTHLVYLPTAFTTAAGRQICIQRVWCLVPHVGSDGMEEDTLLNAQASERRSYESLLREAACLVPRATAATEVERFKRRPGIFDWSTLQDPRWIAAGGRGDSGERVMVVDDAVTTADQHATTAKAHMPLVHRAGAHVFKRPRTALPNEKAEGNAMAVVPEEDDDGNSSCGSVDNPEGRASHHQQHTPHMDPTPQGVINAAARFSGFTTASGSMLFLTSF